MKTYNSFSEFKMDFSTRSEREDALREMSNEQIDALIKGTSNIQGKIYLSSFKK